MKNIVSLLLITAFCFSSVSANQTIIKTPQEAAKGFYAAWRTKNRHQAEKYARTEVIDKFFGIRRHTMTFKGCHKQEDSHDFECIYENKKLDLSFAMIVKVFRVGYKVTSITFSSEAI